jgi:imidazoleglycerol-phosphate dehydratase
VNPRTTSIERETKETHIAVELSLDGTGRREIATPLPFLDHLLDAFARHGFFDLTLRARGDIEVDGHHTVEDIGRALGAAFRIALGDRSGISRFGAATLPMDETLATCAVDFGGRTAFVWQVAGLERRWVGGFDCELAREFFAAFADRAQCNLHLVLQYGGNAHHILEALFKAFARACDAATRVEPRLGGAAASTKGTLSV